MKIRKLVKKLIKKHGTNNPYHIAEGINLIIVKRPLNDSIKGFYQYFKRNKIIYINSNLPCYEQKIICGHELGHAILHPKLNIMFLEKNTLFIKNKYEIEANKFAAELLIPDDIISSYPNYYTLEQIAVAENIYVELLKLKFQNLSIFYSCLLENFSLFG